MKRILKDAAMIISLVILIGQAPDGIQSVMLQTDASDMGIVAPVKNGHFVFNLNTGGQVFLSTLTGLKKTVTLPDNGIVIIEWEDPGSPVEKAITALQEACGLRVRPEGF